MQKFHSLDSRHRLREKLIAVIEASDTDWEGELEDNASLIRSGRLDSLGLFNVTLFVEREIGRPMDFTAFDLAKEWDTVSDILNFIDKQRGADSESGERVPPRAKISKATASAYEVVPYQPALKTQVIELQTHLWGPSLSLNTTYFEWKYERNPYIDEPLIFLAMHHDRAVGMRGFFGVQWEGGIPTEKCIGLYADDLVIVPEHRNQGLIPRIMAAAFEDLAKRRYQFVFNLSAGPVTFLSSLAMDWRSVGSMRPWRWRSWKAACKNGMYRLLKRWPGGSPKPAELFLKWAASRRRPLAEVKNKGEKTRWPADPEIAVEDSPRCAAMAELVERIGSQWLLTSCARPKLFRLAIPKSVQPIPFPFLGKGPLGRVSGVAGIHRRRPGGNQCRRLGSDKYCRQGRFAEGSLLSDQ